MSDQGTSSKDRLSKWRKPMYLPRLFTGASETNPNDGLKKAHPWGPMSEEDRDQLSMTTFYASARELIFDVVDGQEIIRFICHLIDPETNQICATHLLDSVEASEDEIVRTLAYAHIYEIPIFPNTPELCDRLVRHYKHLFTIGFKAQKADQICCKAAG